MTLNICAKSSRIFKIYVTRGSNLVRRPNSAWLMAVSSNALNSYLGKLAQASFAAAHAVVSVRAYQNAFYEGIFIFTNKFSFGFYSLSYPSIKWISVLYSYLSKFNGIYEISPKFQPY